MSTPGTPSLVESQVEPCTRPIAIPTTWTWPEFWDYTYTWMKQQGYAHSTARLYRQVLRNFVRFAGTRPACVNKRHINHYLSRLGRGHCSAHWTAINLSTLRTIFDQLFGLELMTCMRSPRRPHALPYTLNADEARDLFGAAESVRDRLLVGLLYGCGLTVSEIRCLCWRDLDTEARSVRATGTRQLRARSLPLPESLLPLVQAAGGGRPLEAPVFPGRRNDQALTARRIEQRICTIADRAELGVRVTPQILRHSFAVQCLENGENIRVVQEAMGHHSIHTTMRYARCLLPPDVRSPLDALFLARPENETAPPSSDPDPPVGDQEGRTPALLRLLRRQFGSRASGRRRARRGRAAGLPWRRITYRSGPTSPAPP